MCSQSGLRGSTAMPCIPIGFLGSESGGVRAAAQCVGDNCTYLQGRGANDNNSFPAFREKNTQPFIYSVYLWIMKYYCIYL